MELFERSLVDIGAFLAGKPSRVWETKAALSWPAGGSRNIVLAEDMAVELGSPSMESLACMLWTGDVKSIKDGRITLIGPDIQAAAKELPFGKIVLLGVTGFDEDNTYDRYRELEEIRYGLDLKGYMLRAVSQYMREWGRISNEALHNGFSFEILGSQLIDAYRKMPYVSSAECIFVTSSTKDVMTLQAITKDVGRLIGAMNKMAAEMDYDCQDCEYQDVCDEAVELKEMRERIKQKREAGHG